MLGLLFLFCLKEDFEMSMLQIGIMLVIGYLCLYSIVDRICKCVEECARFKSYNEYIKNGANTPKGDVSNNEND